GDHCTYLRASVGRGHAQSPVALLRSHVCSSPLVLSYMSFLSFSVDSRREARRRDKVRRELLDGATMLSRWLRLQCGELFHLWHHDDIKFRQRSEQLSQINPALEELCLWDVRD